MEKIAKQDNEEPPPNLCCQNNFLIKAILFINKQNKSHAFDIGFFYLCFKFCLRAVISNSREESKDYRNI